MAVVVTTTVQDESPYIIIQTVVPSIAVEDAAPPSSTVEDSEPI